MIEERACARKAMDLSGFAKESIDDAYAGVRFNSPRCCLLAGICLGGGRRRRPRRSRSRSTSARSAATPPGTSRWRRATTSKAGLDVTIIPSQGTAQAIQSVESKAAQFAFSDVAGLVAARANSAATAKMVAVIYQKAPYAIFSLRSGANVTKPEQLENLEIASGAGSLHPEGDRGLHEVEGAEGRHREVHQHRSGGARRHAGGKKIPAIETFAMSMPGVVKAAGAQDAQMFLLANDGLHALLQRHSGARGLSQGRTPPR